RVAPARSLRPVLSIADWQAIISAWPVMDLPEGSVSTPSPITAPPSTTTLPTGGFPWLRAPAASSRHRRMQCSWPVVPRIVEQASRPASQPAGPRLPSREASRVHHYLTKSLDDLGLIPSYVAGLAGVGIKVVELGGRVVAEFGVCRDVLPRAA